MSINKAILVGNVGNDPEIKYLEGGTPVAKFSFATTETYKNKQGEKVSTTEWHNIVAWRHLADICERFIQKGKQLYIEGKITNRTWEDQDGNKRYMTEIVANNIQMLGRKDDSIEPMQSRKVDAVQIDEPEKDLADPNEGFETDLPF